MVQTVVGEKFYLNVVHEAFRNKTYLVTLRTTLTSH